jgi:hypothetical protein
MRLSMYTIGQYIQRMLSERLILLLSVKRIHLLRVLKHQLLCFRVFQVDREAIVMVLAIRVLQKSAGYPDSSGSEFTHPSVAKLPVHIWHLLLQARLLPDTHDL